jgi:integrase/recombinase XerC
MPAVVARTDGMGWRVEGSWPDAGLANRFLAYLVVRAFALATVRAYAYELVNFGRFCVERGVRITDAVATDVLDYLEWQRTSRPARGGGPDLRSRTPLRQAGRPARRCLTAGRHRHGQLLAPGLRPGDCARAHRQLAGATGWLPGAISILQTGRGHRVFVLLWREPLAWSG